MAGAWKSQNLIYRAVEDEDEEFLTTLAVDSEAFMNAAPFLPTPKGKKWAKGTREWMESQFLHAVICLPPAAGDEASKPIPVGQITLTAGDARMMHHRNASIAIGILRSYQGKGYGGEAIRWVLEWAFRYAGLHKVKIGAFEYNPGAIRLYKRLGFVQEGINREAAFHNGRFWDIISMGMLEREWRELNGNKEKSVTL